MSRKTRKELHNLMKEDQDLLKSLVQMAMQEVLEAEMTEHLGADRHERTEGRRGYRSGYYGRSLVTRVGKIELRVPQDRAGEFRTEVFERYQRSEKALVTALMEMYVQGVSTRKVKAITEELCGHSFSASTISRLNEGLDARLHEFAARRLEEDYPYLFVDARYERVREGGVVRSRALQIAVGINREGRRCVLAVELAPRESRPTWHDFLVSLKSRGLRGVELVISDAHEGLRQAIREVLPEAFWQRCYVHFLRNALEHVPKKKDTDALKELRWLYERRNVEEARRDLSAWLLKWQDSLPKLCDWVEQTIDETLTFYRFPLGHHKHLRSTNMLERLNEEIKRRTHIVRIFPSEESCLRLARALAVEQHEEWQEGSVYLNMQPLEEERRQRRLQEAA